MLYTRLDFLSYEIRLLNIQDLEDKIIHCTLEQTTLIDPGSYHALSYCWGDLSNKKKIIINNLAIEVGSNLEAALRQLRSQGYLRVWIDALCINQNDIEERGLQIRNMRQIYSQAVYVISWLGDDPDNLGGAVKHLFEKRRYVWFPMRRPTAVGVGYRRGATNEEQEWDTQRWAIFQSFFELSYWRRIWVIQEIASSERVKVLFGSVTMDWKSITVALDHWKEHSDEVPKACASYKYAAELSHFQTRFKGPIPISLLEAIQWSHYALATDQRDKIYALLGLASDGPNLVPMPNYLQTFEKTLCDLTRAIFVATNSSDALSENVRNYSKRGWPWEDAKLLQIWSELNSAFGSPFCSWNTTISPISVQQAPNAKALQTQGILLGQVCQISSPHFRPNNSAKQPKIDADNVHCGISTPMLSNLNRYPSGIPSAILQTLCLGPLASSIDAQSCLNNLWSLKGRKEVSGRVGLGSEQRRDQWDYINCWLRSNSPFTIESLTLQQWSSLHSKKNRLKHLLHGSDMPFASEDFGCCVERIEGVLRSQMRLMVTQTGLIGMAPLNTQIGDSVFYVKGFSIPVILREKEKTAHSTVQEYLVVGGAYAHMDGKLPGGGGFGDWAETYFTDVGGLQSIIIG